MKTIFLYYSKFSCSLVLSSCIGEENLLRFGGTLETKGGGGNNGGGG